MKHIVFTISQLGGGGAERVVSVWANKLASQGMQVSIVLMHRQDDEYRIEPHINVISLGESKEIYLSMHYLQRLIRLRKAIKELSPTTLINFLPSMQIMVYIATLGMRIYRIETVRNNPWKIYPQNGIESTIWNRCIKKADRVILQTNGQKEFFPFAVIEKSVVIPNPVDTVYEQEFTKVYNDKACRFVAVGRIHPQKNYPTLIKAFSSVCRNNNGIYLDIFGSGDPLYEEELEGLISSLSMQDRIHLCGKTAAIVNEYRSGDAYIMSSDYEGMPNALAEAMASRMVCISTNCPTGPADLITDGEDGYLVSVGDKNDLARKIEQVSLMTIPERKQMAEKARLKVLNFCGEENSVNQLKEILR